MREKRPIRQEEAEEFLRLMCDVFGLDLARARTVFFGEPMFDLDRKWALFEHGRMLSVLTTTPLSFGWGRAHGIAGVATLPEYQGQGLATELLQAVQQASEQLDETPSVLFAREPSLYEKNGYEIVDEVIRSPLSLDEGWEAQEPLPFERVRHRYDQWAFASMARLRRGERRWRYWNWHYRVCMDLGEGYIASEPDVLREAILPRPMGAIPAPPGTEWYGQRLLADDLALPLLAPRQEMFMMTRACPSTPRMFMTDQF
jgi:GNAT superfamily N-acetyltransferase